MIQELLGEAATGLIGPAERSKLSVPSGVSPSPSPSQSPSPSSSTTTTPTNSSSTSENLRCPRCDSTNTKFCYYNNYNLTQPRHFCKTCRRYWTKGGALRNVPIGGGCRKNRATTITSAAAAAKSNNNAVKLKPMSAELGKSSSFISSCFEHEISSNPILFASPHQNSHLLSLLRANSNPNPNPNTSPFSNSATIKDEPLLFQSHMGSLDSPVPGTALNARILGLDPLGPVSSSVWRNNQQQQQNGFNFNIGELQSSGLQDFYQRLRSSTNYYQDHASAVVGNVSAASTSSAILESAPVVGAAELGFWNPVLSWSDLPTTHGAYQ